MPMAVKGTAGQLRRHSSRPLCAVLSEDFDDIKVLSGRRR